MSTDTGLRGLDLLDAAIAHIEKHPETWEQGSYRCETGMCAAGWIATLAGGQWATPPLSEDALQGHGQCMIAEPGDDPATVANWGCTGGHIHVAERADRLLGISRYPDGDKDGHDLFDGLNDLGDLKRIRDILRQREATS